MERDQVVTTDPEIMGGTPVFAGTRVPVASLLDHLKAGDSLDDFLDGFPGVRREQAEAFLELAHREEIERRVAELRSGAVEAIPGEQVFAELEELFRRNGPR